MNTSIASGADFYVAIIEGNLAACFAVIHFPHPRCKKFKRGHRLVVLPEFQGLGLGHVLSSEVADYYVKKGYRFIITSNTKALYKQRARDPRWRITRAGRINAGDSMDKGLRNSGSQNRITIGYEYIGDKQKERDI